LTRLGAHLWPECGDATSKGHDGSRDGLAPLGAVRATMEGAAGREWSCVVAGNSGRDCEVGLSWTGFIGCWRLDGMTDPFVFNGFSARHAVFIVPVEKGVDISYIELDSRNVLNLRGLVEHPLAGSGLRCLFFFHISTVPSCVSAKKPFLIAERIIISWS
jgi:hypothetical protein